MTLLIEIKKWKPKIDLLQSKQNEINDLKSRRKKLESEVKMIYDIVFQNFVSKRQETTIPKDKENETPRTFLCLNKDGFSYKSNYYNNSSYVNSFEEIRKLFEDYKEILNFVKKTNKKRLIKIFGKEFNKIKILDNEITIKLDNHKKIYDYNSNEEEKKTKNYILCDGNVLRFLDNEKSSYFGSNNIDILRFDVDDLVNIEIFYKEIIDVLKKYKKFMIKVNNEREKLRDNLKQTFSSELILNKLKIEKV